MPERGNPNGALAYSSLVFQDGTEVLGEGHLPENLVGRELHEVLGKLNSGAQWDRRSLKSLYEVFSIII